MTKSIEKQQAAMAAATIAQRVGSDTSAVARRRRSLSMHFANSQMQPPLLLLRTPTPLLLLGTPPPHGTAVPSHWLCFAKESESESESPLRKAGDVGGGRVRRRRGACSGSNVGSVRKSRGTHRHPRHPTVVAL